MDIKDREVQEWGEDLEPTEQMEVISNAYPDANAFYEDDVMWNALDWKIQLQIYKEWNE